MATTKAINNNEIKNKGGSIAKAGDINNKTETFSENISNAVSDSTLAVQHRSHTLFTAPVDNISSRIATFHTEEVLQTFPIKADGIISLGFRKIPITSPTINIDNLAGTPSGELLTINVKDFGASGANDSNWDDQPAIQAAINFAHWQGVQDLETAQNTRGIAHGHEVFFPPGTYYINDSILLPRSSRSVGNNSGDGRGTVKLRGTSMGASVIRAMATFPPPASSLISSEDENIKGMVEWAYQQVDVSGVASWNGGTQILLTTVQMHKGATSDASGGDSTPWVLTNTTSGVYDGLFNTVAVVDSSRPGPGDSVHYQVILETPFLGAISSGTVSVTIDARHNEISDLTFVAPDVSGVCPIAFKGIGSHLNDTEATVTERIWVGQRLHINLHDCYFWGDMVFNPASFYARGTSINFSSFHNLTGRFEPSRSDISLPKDWGFLIKVDERIGAGVTYPGNDRGGLQWSSVTNCHGFNNQLFWGRLQQTRIDTSFSAGYNNSPVVKVMNGSDFLLTNLGLEGRSEQPAQVQLVNCWGGVLQNVVVGAPIVWPATAPGSGLPEAQNAGHGILLQNCKHTTIHGRPLNPQVIASFQTQTVFAHPTSGSHALLIDENTFYTHATNFNVGGHIGHKEVKILAPARNKNYIQGISVDTQEVYAVGQHPLTWLEGTSVTMPQMSMFENIVPNSPDGDQVLAYNSTLGAYVPASGANITFEDFDTDTIAGNLFFYNMNTTGGILNASSGAIVEGDNIGVINDFSSNNNHGRQFEVARQATLEVDERGQKLLRTGGGTSFGTNGNFYTLNSLASTSGSYTVYMALEVTSHPSQWTFELNGNIGNSRIIFYLTNTTLGPEAQPAYQTDAEGLVTMTKDERTRYGRHIYTFRMDGNSNIGRVFIDGLLAGSGVYTAQTIIDVPTGGHNQLLGSVSGSGFTNDTGIYAMLFYEGAHIIDQLNQVHRYLAGQFQNFHRINNIDATF